MTTDEEIHAAAESLGDSVLVTGVGDVGSAAAERVARRSVPATDDAAAPDVVVIAVCGVEQASTSGGFEPGTYDRIAVAAPVEVAVVVLPPRPGRGERDLLEALADRVDAVILVGSDTTAGDADADALAGAISTFASIVREAGFVNLDLADAQTVLDPVEFAALGVGTRIEAADAVAAAFASLPAGLETDPASGVLVDLVGGPAMSVEDVSEAVTTVRGRVGPSAHVIWGGAVDGALDDAICARLVCAGVGNARTGPGDHCPRCDVPLSAYTLGGRTALSCDRCGYAGVSVRLRE